MTNRKVEMSVTLRKLRRGENGMDGVGAYILDLDNENINIGLTNSNGSLYPASGFNSGESGIYVAGGADNSAALSRVELIDTNDNVLATATASSNGSYTNGILGISSLTLKINKISVVFDTAKAHSSGERIDLRLRGTIGVVDSAGARNVTAYKTLSVMFQPPGADGVSPVVYELKPSVNSVVISKTGVRTPSTVTCKVIKHVGTDYIEVSNLSGEGLTLQAASGNSASFTSSVNVENANDLLWMLRKNNTVIDEETIAFVKDGNDGQAKNGTSPIILDLDNENESVPCNYNGTPIGTVNITSNASLYDGSTKITTGITWAIDKHNCSASISNGVVSVTAISADSAYVDVKATYQSKIYTARLSITKVRGGANGTSPTLYSIQPSVDAIHKDKDGNLSTSSITCTKYKQIGNGARQPTTEKFLWCVVEYANGAPEEKEYDGTVAVSANTKDVLFILYEDSNKDTVLDRETVFVVSDGSDGLTPVVNDGKNAIVPVVTPSSISYTAGVAKNVPLNIVVMDGDTPMTPSNVTVKFGSVQSSSYGGITYNSGQKKIEISDAATFNGILTFSMVYRSKQYTATVQINKVLNGDPGPAGLIYRKTEWAIGREYHNDTALLGEQALCYLDIVYQTDKRGQLVGVWTCRQTHTATDDNRPDAIESNAYWELCHIFEDPIYTSLILAQGSVIAFMQGNELKIFDTMGNLKAGISAASGSYPIIYANPQKYPTDVQVSYAVTTNMIGINSHPTWHNNADVTSSNKIIVANNNYLHLLFTISWSDGTTSEVYERNHRNTTGTQLQSSSPMVVGYRTTQTADSADGAPAKATFATSVAKPYLWVGVTLASEFYGWYQIAEQTSGAEDTTKAVFQVNDSGDAIFGMPSAAHLHLVAAPKAGLPRMDIYDELGNPAAIFDGSTILDGDMLYSSDIPTGTIPATTISVEQSPYGSTQRTNISSTVTCDREGILTIPAFSVNLTATMGSHPNQNGGKVYVLLMIDGGTTYSQSYTLADGEQLSKTVHFSERSKAVSAGIHDVSLVLHYVYTNGEGLNFQAAGTSRGQATIQVTAPITFRVSSSVMRSRYFANGIAIGSSTSNYFMVWNDGDKMQFVAENPTAGIRVTSDKVQIKRNGGNWVDL